MEELFDNSYKRHILLLAIAVTIVNTGFGIIFPIFPKLLEDVGEGNAFDLGVMAAAFGFAYLVGSPIFGNIADQIGKKKVILIGLLGFSLSNFIYIFASSISYLYVARVVEGFFASAILAPAIAMTVELSPKEKRGKYLGVMGASQTAGIIIGPLLGGLLFDGFKINGFELKGSVILPFYVSAAMGFIALIWSIYQLPVLEDKVKRILEQTAEPTSAGIYSKVKITLKRQITVLPKPLYMFILFVLAEMLSMLAWITIEPGFVFYLYDDLDLTATDFGLFVGAFGLVSVMGQLALGNLSDKVGRKPVMIVGQMFTFFFYFRLLTATNLTDLIVAVIFVGIGSGLREPAMKAWLSDVTQDENRATVFGIESGLMSSSLIFGPIIGGYLYITQGMQLLFYVAISLNLINLVLLSTLWFAKESYESIKIEPSTVFPATENLSKMASSTLSKLIENLD